jgi:hypothetical protein
VIVNASRHVDAVAIVEIAISRLIAPEPVTGTERSHSETQSIDFDLDDRTESVVSCVWSSACAVFSLP